MRVEVDGLDALISSFDRLEANADELAKRALYKGAGMMADEIRKGINALPVEEDEKGEPPWGTPANRITGVTSVQKQDLLNALGISQMKEEGSAVTVSVGFDGTGRTRSKSHPEGLPNAALMRSVESGSSFRQKHPVVRPAVNKLKKTIEQAMLEEVSNEIRKEF